MYPGPDGWWWWMGGMMLFGLLILVGVGFLLYYAMRPRGQARKNVDDPLEVARMRLARGEITLTEFEEIRKKLSLE